MKLDRVQNKTHTYMLNLFFDKVAKALQWGNGQSFQKTM